MRLDRSERRWRRARSSIEPSLGRESASEHAAPDLEALLPNKINGVALKKGSMTGAVVFGSDALSRDMTSVLASVGKTPQDHRFANARDPSDTLDLEVGVFEVRGLAAPALKQEIVSGSLPDAPGLATSTATLSGKPVTLLAYPGGSVLYLYAHEGRVFYVGKPRGWRRGNAPLAVSRGAE